VEVYPCGRRAIRRNDGDDKNNSIRYMGPDPIQCNAHDCALYLQEYTLSTCDFNRKKIKNCFKKKIRRRYLQLLLVNDKRVHNQLTYKPAPRMPSRRNHCLSYY